MFATITERHHAPHSSRLPPYPCRILHVPTTPPALALGFVYAYRSSDRVRPTPILRPLPLSVPAAPSSQPVHQPAFPPSLSSSPTFPLPFALESRPRTFPFPPGFERGLVGKNLDDDPSGLELEYDSDGSMNEIRFGVDVPDELPVLLRPMPNRSGTLSMDGEGEGTAGVGETGVEGTEFFFKEDCLGGDWVRDVVCRPLVKSRETEAVAVDVLETGATVGGDKREGLGRGGAE